jgi:hypothetical protein
LGKNKKKTNISATANTKKWKCVTEQENLAPDRRSEYGEVWVQLTNNTFREAKIRKQKD